MDCSICGYEHKTRPISFCIALRDHNINKPKVKTQIVKDILGSDLVKSLELRGIIV